MVDLDTVSNLKIYLKNIWQKNWEKMFVSAEKAFSLNAGDPSVLSNLAVNVAFGGECNLNDVTSQDEQTKNINKKKCQFHKGCWDMGLKAHELDTGNVVTMDNYMLAACYNIVKDGANALKMMSPMPHKKRFWYEIHSGVASYFDGKFEIAQDHFENVKNDFSIIVFIKELVLNLKRNVSNLPFQASVFFALVQ